MKKLLALILCVMLFVSVIPMAAFAADTAAASGKTDPKAAIEKAIKDAIAYKNEQIKTLNENYAKAKKDFLENAENGVLALQKQVVDSIVKGYTDKVDEIVKNSTDEYTKQFKALEESMKAEIVKMFPAVASAS